MKDGAMLAMRVGLFQESVLFGDTFSFHCIEDEVEMVSI
jgi:hypothetical protein